MFDRFTQKTGLGQFTQKGTELRHARLEETRLLNDLAVEQKEVALINTAIDKSQAYDQIAVTEFLGTKKCNSVNHFKTFQIAMESLKKAMDDVNNVDHQWTKAERQEVGEMRRLVKEMASSGVSDADRTSIEGDEKILLEFYIKGNKAVKKALSAFNDVHKFHETVDSALLKRHYNSPGNVNLVVDLTGDPKLMSALGKIDTLMPVIRSSLAEAVKAEEDAVAMTISLAKRIKDKWLVK
mgnify:CR=1 FL=1